MSLGREEPLKVSLSPVPLDAVILQTLEPAPCVETQLHYLSPQQAMHLSRGLGTQVDLMQHTPLPLWLH